MPFYEYQCKNCGHQLEAMQKVSDSALKKCPHCGKSQLQRLMSAPVFRLKGGGWYETDFKDDKDKKRNLADRETEPAKTEEPKKKDAAVADAAPAAAAPAKDSASDKPTTAPDTSAKKKSSRQSSKRAKAGRTKSNRRR